MAALKGDPDRQHAKSDRDSLQRVMRDFEDLVLRFETGLLRSLDDHRPDHSARRRDDVRQHACRLAIAELGDKYTRRQIRRSLTAAENMGRRVEQQLHDAGTPAFDDDLRAIHHGYFRLYSTELFDMLGQPTDLRLGTVRFHHVHAHAHVHAHSSARSSGTPDADADDADDAPDNRPVSVELALGHQFFVADSLETMPFHSFKLPHQPSLQNRGILSRKPDDAGAFPTYDSWLLFTFLGNGCLKLEIPIEMCADVYGGPLRGRENEEVHFWGVFVDDDAP
jgi:hypothetical protein